MMWKKLNKRVRKWWKKVSMSDRRMLDDWADDVLGDLDERRSDSEIKKQKPIFKTPL